MITVPAERMINFGRLNSLDALKFVEFEAIDQYVQQHTALARPGQQLHVVFTSFTEANTPCDKIEYTLRQFAKFDIKVTLLLNSYMNHWEEQLKQLPCDIIFIDYFLWRTYCEVELKKHSSINPQWNADSDKFLFLTGKPNKVNRIRLLWKLHQQNLMSHAVWSLFVNDSNIQSVIALVPELDDKDFESFVNQYNNNPDQIHVVQNPYMDLHYGGIPFDHGLYQSTRFRLIAESHMGHDKPWITEKTWITIANNHPFILAGDAGTCDRLQHMGFRTFNQYLKIPDYDQIPDIEKRLDAVVENTAHLLGSRDNDQTIADDTKHNRRRFLELGESNQKKLNDFFAKYQIPAFALDWYVFSRDMILDEYMEKINQKKETSI